MTPERREAEAKLEADGVTEQEVLDDFAADRPRR
jgi:hypothetical protein